MKWACLFFLLGCASKVDPEELKLKQVTVELLQKAASTPGDENLSQGAEAACDKSGLQKAKVSQKTTDEILAECSKYLPQIKANAHKK